MAEPKVTGLRSIDYYVTDVATSARFYENCWGLAPVAREGGSQYLRATGAERTSAASFAHDRTVTRCGHSLLG